MDWTNFASMDPHLLVGLVNTEIRNNCDDLEDLCRTHEVQQAELISYLAEAGYVYFPEQNKFR
ncbi:MAG TPA: hypothetical protein DCX06_03580 [Opitutae bacterium]|nr:hypothetical protein [Opitutae bacterium]